MGKKKSQKNKGEASQEQKAQPQETQQPQPTQQQPPPAEPTPGTSQSVSSKGGKRKKQAQQQQVQQHEEPQEKQQQQPTPPQPQLGQPEDPSVAHSGKGKSKKQQKKQAEQQANQQSQAQPPIQRKQEPPSSLPVQETGQQRGFQQQQQRVPRDGRGSSQQSTPSPQPEPQQQGTGRGKGRGQPPQQHMQRQHSGSPHSPSPQPSQGPWQGQQPQQYIQRQHPGSPQSASSFPSPSQGAWQGQQPQQGPPMHHPQQYQQPPGGLQQQFASPQQMQQQQMQQQQLQQQQMHHQQMQMQHQQMQLQQMQHLQQQMHQAQLQPPAGPQQQSRPPPGLAQQFQQQQQAGTPQRMTQQPQIESPPQMQQQPQPVAPQTAWQKGQQQAPPQLQSPPQQSQLKTQQVQAPPQQTHPTPQQPRGPQPGQVKPRSRHPQQPAPTQEKPKPAHEPSPPLELVVPQRKKLKSAGTTGRRILIETNHLALILRNLNPAVHYDVVIEPDTPKKLLRPAMEAFRRQYYPNRYPAFDGTRNLYSSPELPFRDEITGEVTISEDERPKKFIVTVKFAAMVDLSVLSKYFEGGQGGSSLSAGEGNRHMITPHEAIQCLDVVLRSAPALHCTPVGRSFFTKPRDQIINLGDGMEMYYGFYQSAILGWKPFLNVDVAHKAFPKSMPVLDLILELCNCDLKVKLNQYNYETVDKFMRTLKVQYEIPTLPTSKRVMRVNTLDRPSSEARFRTDDGEEMTVAYYFSNVKKYALKYPNMPCLWVGSKTRESKILFPAELCTIMEAQVTNRAMTPNQTSALIKVAATSTDVRKNKIMHGIRAAHFNQDPSAKEFGISVDDKFARVEARVLDAPSLRYATKSVRPQRGCWRAETFKDGRSLLKWCIVCVDDRTRPQALQEFADMMIQQGRPVGMKIDKPNPIVNLRLPYRREKQELEQQFSKLKGMELILVVIPTENKDTYNYVKQVAELSVGTLTQCVRARNVFRPKPATVGNILLKVNAKLNGVNHVLEIRPRCLDRPCMIMGADVTHPSPESRGTVPSVAAVTASHDPQAFKYNICWRLQPPTQEIITDLADIVRQHLLFFYTQNKNMKPERIIFFRDGVSEGQFEAVLNAEVHTIRQACTMLQKDGTYKPKITFLVVQKRHHTRFFPTNPRDSEDKNCNVPAGTIVDTEITHPTALDFYLVSHASIQGVARPTKYRMLWDDNDMNEDELEQLTYHLCHMFTRCTRSVSYPAPTYYAHLAAARAKVYCERRQVNMDDLEREQAQLTVKSDIIKDLPMFFV